MPVYIAKYHIWRHANTQVTGNKQVKVEQNYLENTPGIYPNLAWKCKNIPRDTLASTSGVTDLDQFFGCYYNNGVCYKFSKVYNTRNHIYFIFYVRAMF